MRLSIADLQQVFKVEPILRSDDTGRGPTADISFAGVSTDSRKIRKGEIFFALEGAKYDGHDFAVEAVRNGATATVVSRDVADLYATDVVIFRVGNTLKALGDLADYHRRKFSFACVAVTGSNGKTTTKDMLAACLETRFRTVKSGGNLNNLIGLPLSLFELNAEHEAGVFELGMSALGEISRLAEILKPQVGVFTNIAPVHLATMGTIDEVARAKYELVEKLPRDGTAVINADDRFMSDWLGDMPCRAVTYGIENAADCRVTDVTPGPGGKSTFTVNGSVFEMSLPGLYNIYNAAAAIAGAVHLGADIKDLAAVISSVKASPLRSDVFTVNGVVFIDDCYNANPVSMQGAIDMLTLYHARRRRIAVLADMLELGDNQAEFHVEIGWYLKAKNIDALFTFGDLSKYYGQRFDTGFKQHFANKLELIKRLRQFLRPGDVVLVKGSRGMAMEEVTQAFRGCA